MVFFFDEIYFQLKIYVEKYKMAEGGDFGYDYGDTVHLLEDYKYDEDDNDAAQQANRTQPFQPGQASTPYYGGEQVEMQTMQHEQTSLPYYAETSFGGEPTPTTDEFSARLFRLCASLENSRINRRTGVLDISKIPDTKENPLSENDRKKKY